MKKNTKMIIGVVLALIVLIVGGVYGVQRYQQYFEETYLVIDEVKYRRDSTSLDLSGAEITEFAKLKELTCLESLDLRDTGITIEQHDELQAALPDCQIRWSVPFQGSYCDSETTELDLDILTQEDLDVLAYMPQLTSLKAESSRNYAAIMELMERYPAISVSYTVEINGKVYSSTEETLDVTNPSSSELMEKLAYLPHVKTVNLTGQLPANEELLQLQQTYPSATFVFDFEVFGVATNTLAEFLDLSNIKFSSAEEIDAIMPHFYNLSQIDMVNCGISNADMDALNKRYPDTKIVWTVNVCGVYLRTDALYFMPYQYGCGTATGAQCYNLRYCTDMQVVDLGHYGTNNVDFVQYMPNLKCLLICDAYLSDATAIGNCTSLEYVELQMSQVTDFWPLTNLTNLRDLNLAGCPNFNWQYGRFGDITPLTQMKWLDRLWLPYTVMSSSTKTALQEALPNTTMVFESGGCTTGGFRYTPLYFFQRDVLGMFYNCN